MGTNYYLRHEECECCKRHSDLHIGKSSMGWKFLLHGYRYDWDLPAKFNLKHLQDFNAWQTLMKQYPIYNEYGDKVDYQDLINLIEEKQGEGRSHVTNPDVGIVIAETWVDEDGYEFMDCDFS